MKRATSILAGFVLLLLTITPANATPGQAVATPSEITSPTVAEDLPRHTPVSRSARTTTTQAHQAKVTVRPGDTYGALARAHCGRFNAWPAIQQANGWPERRIPVGATASIVCTPSMPIRQPAPKPTLPKTNGATWVHPLASGKLGTSPNCWKTGGRPSHEGVDLAQPKGTAIRSVAPGTIHRKAYQSKAGYYVTVNHGNGTFTQYHHMTGHSPLAVGARVNAGQTIGYVGITGNASGYHLHFEVMVGGYDRNTNPATFMRQRGVNIGC